MTDSRRSDLVAWICPECEQSVKIEVMPGSGYNYFTVHCPCEAVNVYGPEPIAVPVERV